MGTLYDGCRQVLAHIDEAGVDVVRALVTEAKAASKAVIIVTHDHAILDVVDTVVELGKEG